MKKTIPTFQSDAEAEKFVDTAISLKLPAELLAAVKLKAKKENIPDNRIIRRALEKELGQ